MYDFGHIFLCVNSFFMNLLLDSMWQMAVNQKRKKRSVQHYLLHTVYAVLQQWAKIWKKSILPHSLN